MAVLARADKVTSDYDHTVNFPQYKTFMWIQKPKCKEPFMAERIVSAVNAQLMAKGLREVSEGANIAVGANFATEEQHELETYYSYLLPVGRYTEAIEQYEQALQEDPLNLFRRMDLAVCLRSAGRGADALGVTQGKFCRTLPV